MAKNKPINQEYWEALKRKTLIESTAASIRLSGVDITEREVEQIINDAKTSLISDKDLNKILSPKQLAIWQYLQKIEEVATGEIIKNTKIARPTVKQTLNKLLRLKKIERIGLGRSTRYRKIG
jgi:O6-methylguanine-DNA--protein-cysteine methyltransferase